MSVNLDRLDLALDTAVETLLAERTSAGHWVGELSTSALSTATAVSALALVRRHDPSAAIPAGLIAGGLDWLAAHQNADGGWGDTTASFSNISTTMLGRAAFRIAEGVSRHPEAVRRADAHITDRYGAPPEQQAEAVRARYGKDRTFSVPILMTAALAGLVPWREVPPLPFELACFPQSWFRFLRLPVVSYALPALIAIGQAVYHHRPPWNPVARAVRRAAVSKSLRVLREIQPSSGGYLEATPLTSFVTMGLASSGRADHPVARHAVEFLARSVRSDGSWPIDTNLATWVTTLSVNALHAAGRLEDLDRKEELRRWIVGQQYRERHPFTGADPGGWAWTDLPGGVPDADDTPGALLALRALQGGNADLETAGLGVEWLLELQNRDGGWPTFCRGWGQLPFDRSGTDLTAHALRALHAWGGQAANLLEEGYRFSPDLDYLLARRILGQIPARMQRGLAYLAREQRPDGSWLPLWFGNQHAPNDENPMYGTARVLAAYRDLHIMDADPARRAVAWIVAAQNPDGGWGGCPGTPSSIEETALAVEVLTDAGEEAADAVARGLHWLVERVDAGGLKEATPIGFYFAKLWYSERLYPVIFTVAALGRARRLLAARPAGRPEHPDSIRHP